MFFKKRKVTKQDRLERRLKELEGENDALQQRLDALEDKKEPVPGLEGGKATRVIQVGGEDVELRPLPPREWMVALEELPSFLLAYAKDKAQGKELGADEFEKIHARVKGWIAACAVGEVSTERLTIPEALHALNIISTLNGLDASLASFFRSRLWPTPAGRGGQEVRRPAKHTN